MLSPDALRRRTLEAAERLERERKLEEERQRLAEEARQREEERRRLEAEELARRLRMSGREANELLKQSIVAASRGEKEIQYDLKTELAQLVSDQLLKWRIDHRLAEWEMNYLVLRRHVAGLVEKMGGDETTEMYSRRLMALDSSSERYPGAVEMLLQKMADEDDVVLNSAATAHLNLNIKPLLKNLPQHEDELMTVHARWTKKDVLYTIIDKLEQAPGWLLSTGGQGLIQRLGESLSADAERGGNESRFELFHLPHTPDRWGENEMLKLVHIGVPIGVSPFPPKILKQVIEAIGFKVALEVTQNSTTLAVKW